MKAWPTRRRWSKRPRRGALAAPAEPAERALVQQLLELPAEAGGAAERRAPHRLVAFATASAAEFHAFYRDCQVVGAPDGVERLAWRSAWRPSGSSPAPWICSGSAPPSGCRGALRSAFVLPGPEEVGRKRLKVVEVGASPESPTEPGKPARDEAQQACAADGGRRQPGRMAESAVEVRRDFRVNANGNSLGDCESPHLGAPEVEVHPTEVLERPPAGCTGGGITASRRGIRSRDGRTAKAVAPRRTRPPARSSAS